MEESFDVNLQEIFDGIERAEVMSVFFPTFRRALVIDTRYSDEEGPMARIMPMVGSPQERLQAIQALRPAFATPKNLTVIPWPRYIDSLVDLGIWSRIVRRLGETGTSSDRPFVELLGELRQLEKAELAAVVAGRNYKTIWPLE